MQGHLDLDMKATEGMWGEKKSPISHRNSLINAVCRFLFWRQWDHRGDEVLQANKQLLSVWAQTHSLTVNERLISSEEHLQNFPAGVMALILSHGLIAPAYPVGGEEPCQKILMIWCLSELQSMVTVHSQWRRVCRLWRVCVCVRTLYKCQLELSGDSHSLEMHYADEAEMKWQLC